MKYQCEIDNQDGGIWEKKETDKTISFKYIDDLHFEPNCTEIKINKYRKGELMGRGREDVCFVWANNGNVIRDWKDGTYTAYHNQAGIPYHFEPLK